MNHLTIHDAINLKRAIEAELSARLENFTDGTGLTIHEIDLHILNTGNLTNPYARKYTVNLSIHVDDNEI